IGVCMILTLPELLLWCNIQTKCADKIKVDPIVLREELAEPVCVEVVHPKQEPAHVRDELGIVAHVLERSTETGYHCLGGSPRREDAGPREICQFYPALRHRGDVWVFFGTFVRCYCKNANLVRVDHRLHGGDDIEINIDVAARKRHRALPAS